MQSVLSITTDVYIQETEIFEHVAYVPLFDLFSQGSSQADALNAAFSATKQFANVLWKRNQFNAFLTEKRETRQLSDRWKRHSISFNVDIGEAGG